MKDKEYLEEFGEDFVFLLLAILFFPLSENENFELSEKIDETED